MVRTVKGIWVSLEALLAPTTRGIRVSGYRSPLRRESAEIYLTGRRRHAASVATEFADTGSACVRRRPVPTNSAPAAVGHSRTARRVRRACDERAVCEILRFFWASAGPPRRLTLLTLRGGKVAQYCAAFLPYPQTGYLGIFLGLSPAHRGGYLGIFEPPKPRTNSTILGGIPESGVAAG